MPSKIPEATPLLDAEIVGELVRGRRHADGKRVAARRHSLGFTQATLACLTGISIPTISRYESGLYTPKDEHKVLIATALAQEVGVLWPPLPVAEARERAIELSAA